MLSFPAQSWNTPVADSRATPHTASLITPRVYLSGYHTASSSSELAKLGITHVVSVLESVPNIPPSIPEANKLHICLEDRPTADILAHLDDTTEFIRQALAENKRNKVLVHCFQGISRSVTVVCAYIIATEGMPASKAILFVRAERCIAYPNKGFVAQLEQFASRYEEKKKARVATFSDVGRFLWGRTAS